MQKINNKETKKVALLCESYASWLSIPNKINLKIWLKYRYNNHSLMHAIFIMLSNADALI